VGCSGDNAPGSYLEVVLNELEQINSATYYTIGEGYAPGDTSAYSTTFSYVKEYINPADTFVGASFLKFKQEDTTSLTSCWDGNRKVIMFHDKKGILLDSFKNDPRPFKVVNAPFFTKTKRLIEYVMETDDSLTIDFKDLGDTIKYSFFIYDTLLDIVGNRIVYSSNPFRTQKGEVAKFYLWINKSNDLPYLFERDMPHDKSTLECRDVKLNQGRLEDFNATDYFPPDYEIREFIRGQGVIRKNKLEGQPAPDWVLEDEENNSIALENLKSKVLLIQFTSVSCGPCRASVPFLNQLESEFDKKDFDFVAIEGYMQNTNVLKSYRRRSEMQYKFLMSTKEVTKSYQIESVPTFFILDEDRVIRKVIRGYRIGSTDELIREAINKLL